MARPEVKRGDIWLVDLGLAQKIRPAVILSVPYLDHERALLTYVPRTTSFRGTRLEVCPTKPVASILERSTLKAWDNAGGKAGAIHYHP